MAAFLLVIDGLRGCSGVDAVAERRECRILAGMRSTMRTPAAMPLRALIVALLLAGFGLWQAWQCTDGMMTSPLAATTMSNAMDHSGSAGHAIDSGHAAPVESDPGMPAGMVGLCITVLASFAAALMLLHSPLKLLGLLRRAGQVLLRPVELPVRAPVLAQLCISRM